MSAVSRAMSPLSRGWRACACSLLLRYVHRTIANDAALSLAAAGFSDGAKIGVMKGAFWPACFVRVLLI